MPVTSALERVGWKADSPAPLVGVKFFPIDPYTRKPKATQRV
jgi:hypothetical protein